MILSFAELKQKYDLQIQGVLHIGAHYGQEVNTYIQHGIHTIMLFEPVPSTFAILQQNVGNKAILVQTALGNSEGLIHMFVETDNQGQSNSILQPALHELQYPHIVFTGKIQVPITRLDHFYNATTAYNFINMDVQGYELEVLKGAAKTLSHIDYIYTEVNRDEVYHHCARVEDLDQFLAEYHFLRVETSWQGGSWGDALYMKVPT